MTDIGLGSKTAGAMVFACLASLEPCSTEGVFSTR